MSKNNTVTSYICGWHELILKCRNNFMFRLEESAERDSKVECYTEKHAEILFPTSVFTKSLVYHNAL